MLLHCHNGCLLWWFITCNTFCSVKKHNCKHFPTSLFFDKKGNWSLSGYHSAFQTLQILLPRRAGVMFPWLRSFSTLFWEVSRMPRSMALCRLSQRHQRLLVTNFRSLRSKRSRCLDKYSLPQTLKLSKAVSICFYSGSARLLFAGFSPNLPGICSGIST